MIRVRGNRVLVKLPHTEETTDTGLYIPEQAKEPPMEGIVLSVGPELQETIKVKDRVVFEQWAGLEVKDKDMGDVILLEQKDLMAVIQNEEDNAVPA